MKRFSLSAPQTQAWLMLLPALLVYLGFALYPMIDVFHLSLLKWNGLTPTREYVGLENFTTTFTKDTVFWTAFKNSLIWTVLSVIFPPLLGFLFALGLNQNIPGRSPLRAIFYLPVIIAPIAVATIWKWMYDPFFGLLNAALAAWHLENLQLDWLGDSSVALYSAFAAYVWETAGFSMVLFLAGLQGVSQTLVEAARIDGAGRWRIFRHVTFPALRTTIAIVLVLSLINSLKAFDIIYGMTGGGPAQSTQTLAMWAYTQAIQLGQFGVGSAISVVLLLVTLIVVLPYLRWQAKQERNN